MPPSTEIQAGAPPLPQGTIPDEPYEAGLTFVPRTNVNQFGASLQTETPLEDMRFETTVAYQRNKLFSLTDSDASPAPQSFVEAHNSGEAVSAELRLLSDSDSSLQWILGTFYFDGEEAYKPLILSPTLTQNSGGKTTSVAGFGEGTWRFSEQWRLTAGLRYTWEDRTFDSAQNGITLVDNEQTSFDRWSPRVSLQFQPSDKTNLYVTASQGFKSGVFNTASTNRTPVDPEVLTAYEIGVKSDPFDWLRVNAAAFTHVYGDMQFSARDSAGLTRLLNVGEASIEGVELEIIAAATRSLTLRLSGSYVDAIYESFPNAPNTVPLPAGGNATNVIDASGNQTIKFPKWSYNLAARYSMDVPFGRMDVSAHLYDSATIYYDPNNRLRQPCYTLVNAEISLWLRDETIKLAVFGRNLTDEEVYNTVVTSTRGDYGTLAKPRVIGVSAELRFR
jgi:iron complex outermembrane receptor protein